jgi:hypothetical protein
MVRSKQMIVGKTSKKEGDNVVEMIDGVFDLIEKRKSSSG